MKLPEKLSDCLNEIISQGNAQTRIGVNKMKRKELRPGDKVNFHGVAIREVAHDFFWNLNKNIFYKVIETVPNSTVIIEFQDKYYTISRIQVTRVKRKKKRREFWVRNTIVGKNHLSFNGELVVEIRYSDPCSNEWVHVKEVL